jgi:hypothetical protein
MAATYDLSEPANRGMTPIAEQCKMTAATAFSGGLRWRRHIVVVLPYNDWILEKDQRHQHDQDSLGSA